MSIPISTIGGKVSYAFESVAGTMPTTGYVKIPQITSTPDLNVSPETQETTSMDNLRYTSKRKMLRDVDQLEFGARFTQELYDLYMGVGGVMSQYAEKSEDGLGMWICIDLPELDQSQYLPVEPSDLGMPPLDFNSIADCTLYFTLLDDPVWANDPVYSTETASVVTISGTVADDIVSALVNGIVRAKVKATGTSTVMTLPYATSTVYTFVSAGSSSAKSAVATVSSATTSVSLT